jgi:hypothetical protein
MFDYKEEMDKPLFRHAIESIQIGIEDYKIGTAPRLNSAIRSIYSGTLLLCKHVITRQSFKEQREHVYSYLNKQKTPKKFRRKQRFVNKILENLDGGGRGIDFHHLRLLSDIGHIRLPIEHLHQLRNIRNEVEHSFTSKDQSLCDAAIGEAFLAIYYLLRHQLDFPPIDVIGKECWKTMISIAITKKMKNPVYEAELLECGLSLENLAIESTTLRNITRYFRCLRCNSDLVRQVYINNLDLYEAKFCCAACGAELAVDELIEDAIWILFQENHGEGTYNFITTCPTCGFDTFVVEENECVLCKYLD